MLDQPISRLIKGFRNWDIQIDPSNTYNKTYKGNK